MRCCLHHTSHRQVKLAIKTKSALVPLYIFGQTQMFDQLATSGGVLAQVSRYFSASLTYFWGQFYLQIPYKTALTPVCVVPPPPPRALSPLSHQHTHTPWSNVDCTGKSNSHISISLP
jgi:hypothetical protein